MTTQNHLRAQKIYERLKEQFERQTPTLNHSNSIAVSNPKPSDPTDGSLDDEKELVGYICMASPQQEKPFETEFPILLGDIGKDGEVRLNETRLASCHQQVSDVPDWTMNIDTIQTLNLSALNNAPIGISGSEPSTSHQDNFEFLFGVEELNPFLIGDDLGYAISSYDQQLNNVTNSEV